VSFGFRYPVASGSPFVSRSPNDLVEFALSARLPQPFFSSTLRTYTISLPLRPSEHPPNVPGDVSVTLIWVVPPPSRTFIHSVVPGSPPRVGKLLESLQCIRRQNSRLSPSDPDSRPSGRRPTEQSNVIPRSAGPGIGARHPNRNLSYFPKILRCSTFSDSRLLSMSTSFRCVAPALVSELAGKLRGVGPQLFFSGEFQRALSQGIGITPGQSARLRATLRAVRMTLVALPQRDQPVKLAT